MNYNNKNRYKVKKKKRRNDKIFKNNHNLLIIILIAVLFIAALVLGVFLVKKYNQSNPSSGSVSDSSGTTSPTENQSKPTESAPPSEPVFQINSSITSKNILVADLKSGKILASKGGEDKIYPASLTKLIAALIVAENCDPGEQFTVGSELSFVQPGSSTAKLKEGNVISLEGILDALLLASGNDASYVSGVHVGRKIGGDTLKTDLDALHYFIDMMNKKAKELGADNTNFLNPDGYHQDGHYTTCSDLLKIATAAYNNPLIRASVSKTYAEHLIKVGSKTETIAFNSTNMLLRAGAYNFVGTTGMKTGTTNEAGNCLISTAERGGKTVICILTGASTSDVRFRESSSLLTKAFETLS